jgi:hypothetical protein
MNKLLVCRSHHQIINIIRDGDLSASYHLVEDTDIPWVGSEVMPGEGASNLLVPQLGTLNTAVKGFVELDNLCTVCTLKWCKCCILSDDLVCNIFFNGHVEVLWLLPHIAYKRI